MNCEYASNDTCLINDGLKGQPCPVDIRNKCAEIVSQNILNEKQPKPFAELLILQSINEAQQTR